MEVVSAFSAGVGLTSFPGGEEEFVTVRLLTVFEDVINEEVGDMGVVYANVNNDEVAYYGTGDKGVDAI